LAEDTPRENPLTSAAACYAALSSNTQAMHSRRALILASPRLADDLTLGRGGSGRNKKVTAAVYKAPPSSIAFIGEHCRPYRNVRWEHWVSAGPGLSIESPRWKLQEHPPGATGHRRTTPQS
jgi:hypothetical protein